MQGKYGCTYGERYMYVYLCIQLYRCLDMNTYVYLYTMSSYICVNPSVLLNNLSESQARADKTWQRSWVARRSSYQRSKQSNMRSGSQTRSMLLCAAALQNLWKWCPRCLRKVKKWKISLLSAPVDERFTPVKLIPFQLWTLMPLLRSLQFAQNSRGVPWQDHYTNAL